MLTKICAKCKKEKDISDFSKKSKTTIGSYCKSCHSLYRKEHYNKNKHKYIQKARKWNDKTKSEVRKKIASIKDVPCADCGQKFHHVAMDFDHICGRKIKNVSSLVNFSWSTIEKEIKKCDIVCSNCHRVRTWNRLQEQKQNRLRSG